MPKKNTIRKLASELGIAPSTVHRALSGHPNVSPDTRREVLRAAHKTGYLLPVHEKRNIAIIVPEFLFSGYLECLLHPLETEFRRLGFRLMLISHRDLDLLGDHMIDGIVSLVWWKGLEKLLPQNFAIPILTLNAASNTLENIPQVISDPHGIRLALDYLHHRGCRRIFYLGTATKDTPDAADRLAEFRQFCLSTGQDYATMHLELRGSLELLFPLILKAKPDACFCASESYAVKVGRMLLQAGLRIPQDISLMGLEDHYGNASFIPPITAIRQNFELMAWTAAKLMNDMLTKGTVQKNRKIPFTLIERESVRESGSGMN